MAVSAISRAEDVNDTIHVIVDYRVDKCDVSCCPMVLRR